jgi:hypothetical protein
VNRWRDGLRPLARGSPAAAVTAARVSLISSRVCVLIWLAYPRPAGQTHAGYRLSGGPRGSVTNSKEVFPVESEVPDARQETPAERDDRNLSELIQELRVAGLGVQVLFGFLLSLPFTTRFSQLSGEQRDLYLTCVVLSAVATILLIGPVAYHRLVFRRGMKEQLVRFANRVAILGLTAVGLAVLSAVLLVLWYVAGAASAYVVTGAVGVMLACLWFAVPLASRRLPR